MNFIKSVCFTPSIWPTYSTQIELVNKPYRYSSAYLLNLFYYKFKNKSSVDSLKLSEIDKSPVSVSWLSERSKYWSWFLCEMLETKISIPRSKKLMPLRLSTSKFWLWTRLASKGGEPSLFLCSCKTTSFWLLCFARLTNESRNCSFKLLFPRFKCLTF